MENSKEKTNIDKTDINLNSNCKFIELIDANKTRSNPFDKNEPATHKRKMILKSEVKGIQELENGCSLVVESGGEIRGKRFLEPYDYVRSIMSKPF